MIKEIEKDYLVKKIKSELPSLLEDLSEDYNLVIAGGAVVSTFTNTPINDYDVYLINDGEDNYIDTLFDIVKTLSETSSFVSCSDKSLLVNHSGSLINFVFFTEFKTIQDVFDKFDYTCVMGAYSIRESKFYVIDDFLIDNVSKFLKFNPNTGFPIMSLLRVKKYTDKGYTISRNEMLKISLRISQLNITSFESLKVHIGGMYGLDIKKIFDITKAFDMNEVIEVLTNMAGSYDDSNNVGTNDYSPLINLMLKLQFKDSKLTYKKVTLKKSYSYSNESDVSYLLMNKGVVVHAVSDIEPLRDVFDVKPHNGKVKFYKYICKTDDVYHSFREKNFKYKLGDLLVAENTVGLFCGTLNRRKSFTYSKDNNRVLIELLVDTDDLVKLNYQSSSIKIGLTDVSVKKFKFNKIINHGKKPKNTEL